METWAGRTRRPAPLETGRPADIRATTDLETQQALLRLGVKVQLELVYNPMLHEEVALNLASSSAVQVRRGLASNRSTSSRAVDVLASDPDDLVRCLVARHPCLSDEAVVRLSLDENERVREVLGGNPDVTFTSALGVQTLRVAGQAGQDLLMQHLVRFDGQTRHVIGLSFTGTLDELVGVLEDLV